MKKLIPISLFATLMTAGAAIAQNSFSLDPAALIDPSEPSVCC